MKIKNYFQLSMIALITLAIFSCMGEDGQDGRDGEDGDVYIAYSWLYGPFTYWTTDPGIPLTIFNGTYYRTVPGTWGYAYEAWDGSVWNGSYTIYINEGEPGEPGKPGDLFWQNGANGADGAEGEDICFELACYSIGPSFHVWPCGLGKITETDIGFQEEFNKAQNSGLELQYTKKSIIIAKPSYMEIDLEDPSVIMQEGRLGKYEFRHLFKQIK